MANPIKVCVACGEEFELTPQKPGFANRCLACSTTKPLDSRTVRQTKQIADQIERQRLLLELSNDERTAVRNAEATGRTVLIFELEEKHQKVLDGLGLTHRRNELAATAFANAIREGLQRKIDDAIKAKQIAESKGMKKKAAACEAEVQKLYELSRRLKEGRAESIDSARAKDVEREKTAAASRSI